METTNNSMTTWRIESRISGAIFGEYPGATVKDALDAMARDAGYEDYIASGQKITDLLITSTSRQT